MANLLHGFIDLFTTPFFVIMILAGIIAGRLEKRK